MYDEITRQRLEFCKQQLTQTTHKISTIAAMAGFESVNRLGKVCKRALGISPCDYRQTYPLVRTA